MIKSLTLTHKKVKERKKAALNIWLLYNYINWRAEWRKKWNAKRY